MKFTILLLICLPAFLPINLRGQTWLNLADNNNLIIQNTTNLIGYSTSSLFSIGQIDSVGNGTVTYWDGNNWTKLQSPSIFGGIGGVCSGIGKTYVSGNMISTQGSTALHQKVETWNGSNWEILGGNDSVFSSLPLYIFTDNNNNLYALGQAFSDEKNIVAKWNGSSWSQLGNLLTKDDPNAYSYGGVADHNGKIYLYGNFIDENNKVFMQYWDGTAWQKLIDTIMDGDIRSAIIDNNNNLVISCTRYISNQWTPYILNWNNTSWSQIGDINPFNLYGALYSDRNDNLYCWGGPLVNGVFVSYLMKLVNNQWQEFGGDTSSALNINRRITAITFDTLNNLYAAGYFLDNPQSEYIVRYDSSGNPTSINEVNNNLQDDFTVFPNPNTGVFNIVFDEKLTHSEISVYNMNGIEVYRKDISNNKIETVNLKQFAKGFYILKLHRGDETIVKKITVI